MNNIFNVAEAKKPVYGSSSVISPVIGALGFFAIIHLHPSDPAGFGGAFIAIYFIFGTFVIGLISSIIGFVRRERLKGLYILGFMINILPTLSVLKRILR
jgi:hypothetical protein